MRRQTVIIFVTCVWCIVKNSCCMFWNMLVWVRSGIQLKIGWVEWFALFSCCAINVGLVVNEWSWWKRWWRCLAFSRSNVYCMSCVLVSTCVFSQAIKNFVFKVYGSSKTCDEACDASNFFVFSCCLNACPVTSIIVLELVMNCVKNRDNWMVFIERAIPVLENYKYTECE